MQGLPLPVLKEGAAPVALIDGDTLLHIACKIGDPAFFNALLPTKLDELESRNIKQEAALHLAAEDGNTEFCMRLLGVGADSQAQEQHGSTPLHCAAYKGHVECCRALVEHGVQVDAVNTGGLTPLHHAAMRGHPQVCEALLQAGADCMARTNHGDKPLIFAARSKNVELCMILIDHGAKLDGPADRNSVMINTDGDVKLFGHIQSGVHRLRCSPPGAEQGQLIWNNTSAAKEQQLLDEISMEWFKGVKDSSEHGRVAMTLTCTGLPTPLISRVLGFVFQAAERDIFSCLSSVLVPPLAAAACALSPITPVPLVPVQKWEESRLSLVQHQVGVALRGMGVAITKKEYRHGNSSSSSAATPDATPAHLTEGGSMQGAEGGVSGSIECAKEQLRAAIQQLFDTHTMATDDPPAPNRKVCTSCSSTSSVDGGAPLPLLRFCVFLAKRHGLAIRKGTL
jgi:hypothetical protein